MGGELTEHSNIPVIIWSEYWNMELIDGKYGRNDEVDAQDTESHAPSPSYAIFTFRNFEAEYA